MDAQMDRLVAEMTSGPWRSEAAMLRASRGLREIHLGALREGRSTVASVAISEQRLVVLYARVVGADDCRGAEVCARR